MHTVIDVGAQYYTLHNDMLYARTCHIEIFNIIYIIVYTMCDEYDDVVRRTSSFFFLRFFLYIFSYIYFMLY